MMSRPAVWNYSLEFSFLSKQKAVGFTGVSP
jgi:hypothetical protein